jgi:phage gp46-like protein
VSLDRLIDTGTGDVQPAAAGGFVVDDVLANQIILSFNIALGSWEGAPTRGHRFNELAREIDTVETRGRVGDFAHQAVQWLLDSGALSSIEVDVMSYAPGVVAFEARCYPPSSTKPLANIGLQFVTVGGG